MSYKNGKAKGHNIRGSLYQLREQNRRHILRNEPFEFNRYCELIGQLNCYGSLTAGVSSIAAAGSAIRAREAIENFIVTSSVVFVNLWFQFAILDFVRKQK